MTATFNQLGLQFEYPESWSLEGADDSEALQQVAVSSPHTAFVQVSKHPRAVPLEQLFDEALAALRSDYEEMEAEPHDQTIVGMKIPGYCVNFFCHGLTNTCWLKAIATPQGSYLILCQAEDREFDRVHEVFEAMLTSAVGNLALDGAENGSESQS